MCVCVPPAPREALLRPQAMRFAQMDADGGGSVSFAELVRFRQRQIDLVERKQGGLYRAEDRAHAARMEAMRAKAAR